MQLRISHNVAIWGDGTFILVNVADWHFPHYRSPARVYTLQAAWAWDALEFA